MVSAPPGSPRGEHDVSRRAEEPASPATSFEAARGANDCDGVYCPARLNDQVYPPARLDDHRPITPGCGLDGSHDSDSLFEMVDHSAQGPSPADASEEYVDATSEISAEDTPSALGLDRSVEQREGPAPGFQRLFGNYWVNTLDS